MGSCRAGEKKESRRGGNGSQPLPSVSFNYLGIIAHLRMKLALRRPALRRPSGKAMLNSGVRVPLGHGQVQPCLCAKRSLEVPEGPGGIMETNALSLG